MKRTMVAALAVGSLLLAAGCGDSDDAATSKTSSTAKTPTGEPIVLGTIGGYTGNQAASAGLVDDASKVWEKSVNARGGINGHPVKLIVKDDAADPAKALQAAKELVEQDHVMAIVGMHSLVSASWADYVKSKGVPVVGGVPVEAPFLGNADFFPTGTSAPVMILGQFQLMKQADLKRMGVLYCAESPVCATLGGLSAATSTLVPGTSVGTQRKVAATQPDYSAECLALKKDKVDSLFIGSGAPVVVRVTEACAKLGYKPTTVNQTTTSSTQWLKSAAMEGALLTAPNANYTDESNSGVKEFLDAVEAYAPDMKKSDQYSQNVLWPWIAGKLFEKIATAAGIGPKSTPADVLTALYTVKDETLGGLTPPLTFVKDKPTFVSCWFTQKVDGGKFVTQNSGETTCLTPDQAAGLGKILSGGK